MFTVGQKVRLTHPESDAEREAVFIVAEWNGDRGLIRPAKTTMKIVPTELVHECDIQNCPDFRC